MRRPHAPRTLLVALGLALVAPPAALAAPPSKPGAPQPKPTVKPQAKAAPTGGDSAKLPGRLGGSRAELDADSLLGLQLAARAPLAKGSVATFAHRKVALSGGTSVKLSDLANQSLRDHDTFSTQIAKVPAAALVGGVRSQSEVYEFADSFVIVRSTSVTVADPKALA